MVSFVLKRSYSVGAIGFLLVLMLGAYACSPWKDTKEVYGEYINPDPEVNFSGEGFKDQCIDRFTCLFQPVDVNLLALKRTMTAVSVFPPEQWFDFMIQNFKWLDDVVAVDLKGEVLKRVPDVSIKPLNVEPLLAYADQWNDRQARAIIDKTDFGPEICLGVPFFKENILQGLVVARFDYRSLVKLTDCPNDFLVFSGQTVLWNELGSESAQKVMACEWNDLVLDDVDGYVEVDGRSYYWMARSFAGIWLIYSMTEDE